MTYACDVPTLVAFFGAGSPLHEGRSDVDLVTICLAQLSKIFENIPYPTDYAVSRWKEDPYVLGAFSRIPAGSSFKDMKVLG